MRYSILTAEAIRIHESICQIVLCNSAVRDKHTISINNVYNMLNIGLFELALRCKDLYFIDNIRLGHILIRCYITMRHDSFSSLRTAESCKQYFQCCFIRGSLHNYQNIFFSH